VHDALTLKEYLMIHARECQMNVYLCNCEGMFFEIKSCAHWVSFEGRSRKLIYKFTIGKNVASASVT